MTSDDVLDGKALRQLATDFAARWGCPIEEAVDELRRALIGEAEPLRALHISALHYRDRIPVDTSRKARRKAAKLARRRNR